MAEDPSGGEKTEEASSRKLEKAREEGMVGKSLEVPSVLVILAGAIILNFLGYYIYQHLLGVMRRSFVFEAVPEFTVEYCVHTLFVHTGQFALMLLPVLLAVFVAALAANLMQVGFHISWQALEPKFSKLDPIRGFSNIISKRALIELIKNIAKIFIIAYVAYYAVAGQLSDIVRLYDNDVANILIFILKITYKIFIRVLLVLMVLAFFDFMYQKWKFAQDQKMTRQELKDEFKQTEGDPKIKARIRQLQFEATKRRMMQEAPKADVVVTNPIHLALALQYDALTMNAPRVIAKGAGQIAEKIKEIARGANIPVIENKDLAQQLYKLVDIGEDIPAELFMAVAELLAYVYKLKGKIR